MKVGLQCCRLLSMQHHRHTIALTIPVRAGLSRPSNLETENILGIHESAGQHQCWQVIPSKVLVLWSSSCNNKSFAQLQTTIGRDGETSYPRENVTRHINTQLELMRIAVLNPSLWSTRLNKAHLGCLHKPHASRGISMHKNATHRLNVLVGCIGQHLITSKANDRLPEQI